MQRRPQETSRRWGAVGQPAPAGHTAVGSTHLSRRGQCSAQSNKGHRQDQWPGGRFQPRHKQSQHCDDRGKCLRKRRVGRVRSSQPSGREGAVAASPCRPLPAKQHCCAQRGGWLPHECTAECGTGSPRRHRPAHVLADLEHLDEGHSEIEIYQVTKVQLQQGRARGGKVGGKRACTSKPPRRSREPHATQYRQSSCTTAVNSCPQMVQQELCRASWTGGQLRVSRRCHQPPFQSALAHRERHEEADGQDFGEIKMHRHRLLRLHNVEHLRDKGGHGGRV